MFASTKRANSLALILGLVTCGVPESSPCEDAGGQTVAGVLDTNEAIEHLRGVERICGDLKLTGMVTSLAALETLRIVEGSLIIDDSDIENLELPNLVEIKGHLGVINNGSLRRADLPRLESVGGELALDSNPALTRVIWPNLVTIGSSLLISNNAALSELGELPELIDVHAINVNGNSTLERYDIPPRAMHVESLIVAENSALDLVAGGDAIEVIDEIVLVDNPDLDRVELSISGEIGFLAIAKNAELTDIAGIESASVLERLVVLENPALTDLPGLGPVEEVFILYIAGNPVLQNLGSHAAERITFATIINNGTLLPSEVASALDGVDVQSLKVDGNAGQAVPHMDSCPWEDDGECDEAQTMSGTPGTGLCISDELDCEH